VLTKDAIYGMHFLFAVFPMVGIQMVSSNFFLAVGMPKQAIFLSLTRQLLFLIPCLLVLPHFFGILGVWVSLPMADFISFVLTAYMVVRQFKKFKTTPSPLN
jgi:Na+-driven multidrug efflux pump